MDDQQSLERLDGQYDEGKVVKNIDTLDDISLNYNERIVKEEDDNIIGSQLSKDISRINQADDSPIKNDESSYQFMVQSLQENQEKVGLDTMIMNES